MFNRFLFCKKWGGANLLLLLFLLNGQSMFAQTAYPINCGQLIAYVVPSAYNGSNQGSSCVPCCGGTFDCGRVVYDVYLRVNDLGGSHLDLPDFGEFEVSFLELYLSMKLTRGANSPFSKIHVANSDYCLSPDIDDDDFNISVVEDEATIFISDDALSSPVTITFVDDVNDSQCIAQSKFPIFSIYVDAMGGESLGVACNDFTYESDEICENSVCSGVANAVFPMPSSTNTAFTLTLDDMDCNPEEYMDLPILVSSSISFNPISSFDFLVVINTTAPDGFYQAPEYLNSIGVNPSFTAEKTSDQQYLVRIHYPAQNWIDFWGTDRLMGTIRIYRPPGLCQGYTTTASLIPARIRVGGVCSKISTGTNTSESCVVPAVDACTEDFDVTITSEASLQNCTTLVSYITLSWDPADFSNQTTLPFNQIRAMLDFEIDGDLTISSVALDGMSCPGSGNDPVTCPGGCIQNTSHTAEVCINVVTPVMVDNNARIEVTFTGSSGCVKGVTVRKIVLRRPSLGVCVPEITIDPDAFEVCVPIDNNYIKGDIATEDGCWIEGVKVLINSSLLPAPSVCSIDDLFTGLLCEPYTSPCLCDMTTAGVYTVVPERDDNPLNGITTYDLVLISKHILALEPLTSPYKIIAADINKSGSVTTFDIVEERKLILGIYSDFPANTSWRFVDKAFAFPNVDNPFETVFDEEITLTTLPNTEVDFVGIKVGDVNNTAAVECTDCEAFERPEGMYTLQVSRKAVLRAGDVYTMPVRAGGEIPLIAWQSAFRFDPAYLELIGPSLGDVPGISPDNFNLNQAEDGLIRALWFAEPDAWEETAIQPGQSLFNLTFRVKQDLPESESPIRLDEVAMPNYAWTKEGRTLALQTAVSSSREDGTEQLDMPLWVRCRPNPSMGAVTFDIVALPQTRRAQLNVFDAFGRRVWYRDLGSETGLNQILVPEATAWPAGVYHWELRLDEQKSTGTFVRQ